MLLTSANNTGKTNTSKGTGADRRKNAISVEMANLELVYAGK
jgi:hypothetical protein